MFFASVRNSQRGFTLLETVVALLAASISVMAAYGLILGVGKYHRSSARLADIHRDSRTTMERIFRDISETSNTTINITNDYISFASARDANGEFQLRPYSSVLKSHRPDWQKVIIYYLLDSGERKDLYRKEVTKTNWSANYEPGNLQALDGELIAQNVVYMYFGYYPAETLDKAHVLTASLGFLITRDKVEAGAIPGKYVGPGAVAVELSTTIPIMNRER